MFKITKLIVENFIGLFLATKYHRIEVDLSNNNNRVCLIIGPNGTGKTVLLSLLTPFAEVGNLDVRSGTNLILAGEQGYKEIWYQSGKDHYIIKHFYTPREGKSHSVKSYIMKNGIELNENGNVSSFKEWVKIELGIDTDYLKLIRIGSNVSSLVKLTETERKTFMSKLLDDLGVYLDRYKKIRSDITEIKSLIGNSTRKLSQLDIENKTSMKIKIDKTKKYLRALEDQKIKFQEKISISSHEMANLTQEYTIHEINDRILTLRKKTTKMKSLLEKKNDLESTEVSYYDDKINQLYMKKSKLENDIVTCELMIKTNLNTLNSLEDRHHSMKVQFDKESTRDIELNKMKEEAGRLEREVSKYYKTSEDYDLKISLSELESFIVFLKNTQLILDRAYEFGPEVIKKIISLLEKKENVTTYITDHICGLTSSESETSLFLQEISRKVNMSKFEFDGCEINDCPAKKVWIQVYNLLQEREAVKNEKKDIAFYKDMQYAYENIKTALLGFPDHKSVIDNLPDKIKDQFLLSNLYKKISSSEIIYSQKDLDKLLSKAMEYENYNLAIHKYEELTKDIEHYSELSSIHIIEHELYSITKDIEKTENEISSYKKKLLNTKEDITEVSRDIEYLEEVREALTSYQNYVNELSSLESDYNSYYEYNRILEKNKSDLKMLLDEITSTTNKLNSYEFILKEYISLEKELKLYSKIYDEMILTASALSSKEGIPLKKIEGYLKNTTQFANEMIQLAYNGRLYLDHFYIGPNSFAIPYYNRGKRYDDVKFTSQGELDLITIALSFALSYQSMKTYTIPLIDEMDARFDSDIRALFIPIIEKFLEKVNSDQSFIISHNKSFTSYPVDIINMDFENQIYSDNQYQSANYVKLIVS